MDAVICGIDPGLGTTGYAVIRVVGEKSTILDAGVCRLDKSHALADRLAALDRDISSVLSEHRPDIVAVEQLYAHYKHPNTAILMGHARGVILLSGSRHAKEVRSYAATQVKRYMTGNGRASKEQVQRAVQVMMSLPALPEPNDMADALAIALCCASDVRKPVLSESVR